MSFDLYLRNYFNNVIYFKVCEYLNNEKIEFLNIENILLEDKLDLEFRCYIIVNVKYNNEMVKKYNIICLGNLEDLDNTFRIQK